MGGAPIVILLVGMLIPVVFLLLALLFDLVVTFWVVYRLWHDEWSLSVGRLLHRVGHGPHWHLIRIR